MQTEHQTAEAIEPDIHIGREIRSFMESGNMSASWLAERLCCDRTNIYKIFTRASLDSQMLLRISIFLRHNFFSVYTAAYERSRDTDAIGRAATRKQRTKK